VKRREFVALLGSAAVWPLAARAQQGSQVPSIGVLLAETDDRRMQERLAGLRQGLDRLGWSDGRNIRMVYRFLRRQARSISTTRERAGCDAV